MSERKAHRWDEAAMRQFQARAGRWTSGTVTTHKVVDTFSDGYARPTIQRAKADAASTGANPVADAASSPSQQEPQVRRAAKIDANQNDVVAALRAVGARVAITSTAGNGFPDLIVGYRGRVYPIELKDGSLPLSARRLTPEQVKFHREWAGYCWLANSADEALQIIGAVIPKDAA